MKNSQSAKNLIAGIREVVELIEDGGLDHPDDILDHLHELLDDNEEDNDDEDDCEDDD